MNPNTFRLYVYIPNNNNILYYITVVYYIRVIYMYVSYTKLSDTDVYVCMHVCICTVYGRIVRTSTRKFPQVIYYNKLLILT